MTYPSPIGPGLGLVLPGLLQEPGRDPGGHYCDRPIPMNIITAAMIRPVPVTG